MSDWPAHEWTAPATRARCGCCLAYFRAVTLPPLGRYLKISPTFEAFRAALSRGLGRTAGIVEECNRFSGRIQAVMWRGIAADRVFKLPNRLRGQIVMRFDEPRPQNLKNDDVDPMLKRRR